MKRNFRCSLSCTSPLSRSSRTVSLSSPLKSHWFRLRSVSTYARSTPTSASDALSLPSRSASVPRFSRQSLTSVASARACGLVISSPRLRPICSSRSIWSPLSQTVIFSEYPIASPIRRSTTPARPWKLLMNTLAAACPWTPRMRSCISSRALLVNVRHRMLWAGTPARISRPVRSVSVLVLPEPGPASVRMRPRTWLATCSWAGFNCMGGGVYAGDPRRCRGLLRLLAGQGVVRFRPSCQPHGTAGITSPGTRTARGCAVIPAGGGNGTTAGTSRATTSTGPHPAPGETSWRCPKR